MFPIKVLALVPLGLCFLAPTFILAGYDRFDASALVALAKPTSPIICPDKSRALFFTTSYNPYTKTQQTYAYINQFSHSDNDEPAQTFNLTSHIDEAVGGLKGVPQLIWLDEKTISLVVDGKLQALNIPSNKHLKNLATNKGSRNLLKEIVSLKDFEDVADLKYHSKSKLLIFSSIVDNSRHSKFGDSGIVYDQLFFRHWDELIVPGRRRQLFAMKLDAESNPQDQNRWFVKSNPINLLKGTDLESPIPPFGGADDFDISPDGQQIAFVAKAPGRDQAWEVKQYVYLVSTNGSSKPRPLNEEFKGPSSQPKFSKDGKQLAWLQMKEPQYEADKTDIYVYDIKDKKYQKIWTKWDRSPSTLLWSPSPNRILVTASDFGIVKLFSIDIRSGSIRRMNRYDSVASVQYLEEDILLMTLSSMSTPVEIYTMEIDNYYHLVKQSDIHKETVEKYQFNEPEEFNFKVKEGYRVHGWLLKPKNFVSYRKYPLAFLIHGGPQGAWENKWSFGWNPHLYAQHGYATVMINPTGSTGYGQNLTDSIRMDWGGRPYTDLMQGLDYVIQENKWIDKSRACALGASYGGFMINWLNGHTERFRCLVNHDGMFDAVSSYYTTDEVYFNEHDFGGKPTEVPEIYQKNSPSSYVWKWATPTLVIHSQKDYRLTLGQGLATFTALQRKGISSKFLYFPDENHWVLKPQNQLRWFQEIFLWIDRYCRPYMFLEQDSKYGKGNFVKVKESEIHTISNKTAFIIQHQN